MSDFLSELDKFVLGAIEKAGAEAETSHPSGKADGGDAPAPTGSRASENEKDVKSSIPAQTVNDAKGSDAAGAGRGEKTPTLTGEVKATATGEAPSIETESVKAKPSDPGTSHPSGKMGEKYSAAQLKGMGDEILADIAVATAAEKSAAEKSAAEKPAVEAPKADAPKADAPKAEKVAEAVKPEVPAEAIKAANAAGKEAASLAINQLQKEAAPVVAKEDILANIIKQASVDADNVSDFLAGYMSKKALDTGESGAPLMEEAGEGAPAGAPAGDPAGAPAGAGGPSEQELEQIVQALLEAGVSPEELLALVQGQGGAAGAEGAPAAMPPMPPAGAEAAPAGAEAAMMEAPKVASAEKAAALKTALVTALKAKSGKGVK